MDGACHCGAVRFKVKLAEGLEKPRRCNCSFCRMRGAIVVTAMLGDLTISEGREFLGLYQFNTMQAEHYFCSRCGIYTHHRRRSNPNHLSVNVACLKGVSPFDFPLVPVYDGIVHPPADPPTKSRAISDTRMRGSAQIPSTVSAVLNGRCWASATAL
jgi:hypothetical protein